MCEPPSTAVCEGSTAEGYMCLTTLGITQRTERPFTSSVAYDEGDGRTATGKSFHFQDTSSLGTADTASRAGVDCLPTWLIPRVDIGYHGPSEGYAERSARYRHRCRT